MSVTIYGRAHHVEVEPFMFQFPWRPVDKLELTVQVTLNFQGHYEEPPVTRDVRLVKGKSK